VYVTKRTQSS